MTKCDPFFLLLTQETLQNLGEISFHITLKPWPCPRQTFICLDHLKKLCPGKNFDFKEVEYQVQNNFEIKKFYARVKHKLKKQWDKCKNFAGDHVEN